MIEPTPMMRQYLALKAQHQDKILFFRLGDFYEMFLEDAHEASKLLGLTLTQRQGVPMCGIPYHAASSYIKKLLDLGKRIAVCEQNAPQGGKGMMGREVVEVLSPGAVVDDNLMNGGASQYLVALFWQNQHCALAASDFSTGEIWTTVVRWENGEALQRELLRFQPREILLEEGMREAYPELASWEKKESSPLITELPPWYFELARTKDRVLRHFEVVSPAALGWQPHSLELIPLGVLLSYADSRWPGKNPEHLKKLKKYRPEDYMGIDEATAKSLELSDRNRGGEGFTLWKVLNATETAPGARLLKSWIHFPLKNLDEILARQSDVAYYVESPSQHQKTRDTLSGMFDWERLTSRLVLDKASPRDLGGVLVCLERTEELANFWEQRHLDEAQVSLSQELRQELANERDFLKSALNKELPTALQDGGVFAPGFNAQLDQDRFARDHGEELIQGYAEKEKQKFSLNTLRIKNNKILGYFFEVSRVQAQNLPTHFRRKQSLVGTERYTTDELEALQVSVETAQSRVLEIERTLYEELIKRLRSHVIAFQKAAYFCSYVDAVQSLAAVARRFKYTRPDLHQGYALEIRAGRHPMVEAALRETPFVPNSVNFSESDILHLLTGPNMAGKSTFLRQTALIVLLAQMGSFVPAEYAKVGIVDQIFCRVGSGDDLSRGESTFLVEMNETSYILRQATSSSLIVMDEVGRGTSTRDGLSLAWALCEYLLNRVRAKTLFATHYHELTALEHSEKHNFCLAVEEDGADVIFLRRVIPGAADHSYGIYVARLAGLPTELLQRARNILEGLLPENEVPLGEKQKKKPLQTSIVQASLFDEKELLLAEIAGLELNRVTPLEALNLINSWQKSLKGNR
ncbi:MAG: DNA mismatch repair protein MutS [Spirochaetales bacterium]|nr:DNA mismatch repair protein MutS [Spirochaetales bacterium]